MCGSSSGEARTSLAVVATRNDDTQSVIYRNGAADFELSRADVEAVAFDTFRRADRHRHEPCRRAFARRRRLLAATAPARPAHRLIFDVDYRAYSWVSAKAAAEVCRRFASMCDVVVGNEEEFAVMAGRRWRGTGARRWPTRRCVVYKMGSRGSRAFSRGHTIETRIFAVAPLKPTGAGDAFMAGLATGLAAGLDLEASLRRGCGVGGYRRQPRRLRAGDAERR